MKREDENLHTGGEQGGLRQKQTTHLQKEENRQSKQVQMLLGGRVCGSGRLWKSFNGLPFLHETGGKVIS